MPGEISHVMSATVYATNSGPQYSYHDQPIEVAIICLLRQYGGQANSV